MPTMGREHLLPTLPQRLPPLDQPQHLPLELELELELILPLQPTIPPRLVVTQNTTPTRAPAVTQNMTTRVALPDKTMDRRDQDMALQEPQHPTDRPHLPAMVVAIMSVMDVILDVTLDVTLDVILDVTLDGPAMVTTVSAPRLHMEEIVMVQAHMVVDTALVSIQYFQVF